MQTLAKLTIQGYTDQERRKPWVTSIEAMYNPDSLSLSYYTEYHTNKVFNQQDKINKYSSTGPSDLSLVLIFDARMPGNTIPLGERLRQLKSLCSPDDETGEPLYLSVSWGKLSMGEGDLRDYRGRVKGCTVIFTSFDRDGSPLRAEVHLALVEDTSLTLQQAQGRHL
ncbi:hypothetical protein Sps_01476 [Shewanella psychrophila]|uniref:Contractile injection system tube protein N-terminal domain-containing protein n=1 Tax=Shewanella psychrophila TaxID=225848 RepID=A0A1S6HMA4_9GAMM|nr:hypothetical protein [Shewanella psychrophila]AQS36642.1 hypothetical protein Sps_01476 [Shewanella psychrophila]